MKKYFLILILVSLTLTGFEYSKAQENAFSLYSNTIVLSLNGGLSKGETDYSNSGLGIQGQGSIEYFFSSNNDFSWGIKLGAGYTTLSGDGIVTTGSDNFESSLVTLGSGITTNYNLNKNFIPFISFEVQNIWVRDETAINFLGNLGLRYVLTNNLAVNGSLGLNFVNADNIDNLKIPNTNNDYYTTFTIGLSYSIDTRKQSDIDGDGINDNQDSCPNETEDFDGFQDDDGCPDLDNDNDGILDVNDQCPNIAEDFDGFQDKDGCVDLDNDNDKVLDEYDECPDAAEDFDGFQDEDGCPDLDNDNDGILDVNDKCPNIAETFNSFEDGDGCPDELPEPQLLEEEEQTDSQKAPEKIVTPPSVSTPNEFFIDGESTFKDGAASIKQGARSSLNQIAKQIKDNPGFRWKVEGHMDNSGSPFAIKALSTARANSIVNYFVSIGLSPSIFEVVGLGDKFPTSSNSTVFGRKKNRRVIIKRIK